MYKKSGFTLIEVVLIMILIGMLSFLSLNSINQDYSVYDYQNLKNNLLQYENNVKLNNYLTIYPSSNDAANIEETKYWFKRNLSFVISVDCNKIFSYIMSDTANTDLNKNFDTILTDKNEIYKEKGLYDIGLDSTCNSLYPDKGLINKSFLYKYISKIEIYKDGVLYKTLTTNDNGKFVKIIFYNNSLYLREGDKGDNGSLDFYDTERDFVKNNIVLKLYNKSGETFTININAIGFIE